MKLDSRIFLAGHRGMLGHALNKKLIEKGYKNIITINRSYLDLRIDSDVFDFF